jgi:energy-converting hydrogenase Eha subunit B
VSEGPPGTHTTKDAPKTTLTVDRADLAADKIFLVTGMRTAIPAIAGLEHRHRHRGVCRQKRLRVLVRNN